MEISTYFFRDKCLFGPYPNSQQVEELEKLGVKYFIDLTNPHEKINRYKCNVLYLSYPIRDNSIPEDIDYWKKFLEQIISIIRSLDNGEKLYIHCKGGHGRSGMLVACLLCILDGIGGSSSITKTTNYHKMRPTLGVKWIDKECPNIKSQQDLVKKIFGI